MILLDNHMRTLKPMSPEEFDRRFAAAAADPTENGLRLMKALLDTPVEAPSHFDTSRLPVGTPSVRAFLLSMLGATAPTTRVEFDAKLGDLVSAVERRIRAMVPEASKFEWAGSVVERQWAVTALDQHNGRLAEFDLKMAHH